MLRNLILTAIIALVSSFLTILINIVITDIPFWLLLLLQVVILLGLIYSFATYAWRWRIWQWLGLIKMPVVVGRWQGKLVTSYDSNSKINDVSLYIKQDWLFTTVYFEGRDATSHSLVATFFERSSGEEVLAYIYRAQPLPGVKTGLEPHIGLCVLRLIEPHRLSGYYHYFHYDDERTEFIRGQLVLTRPQYADALTIAP